MSGSVPSYHVNLSSPQVFSHTAIGGKCLLNSFLNDGWLFLSTSADLSCFSNSLSKSCNVSNDQDNLQRTKSREELKMH